jgi:hypothetical protein
MILIRSKDTVMGRRLAVLTVATAALAGPSSALAHGGRGPVVAVNYEARIEAVRPRSHAFEVRVMDGDQRLWVRAHTKLIVLGILDEPLLRFEGGSVFVNERSPTARINGISIASIQPSYRKDTPPKWDRVSFGDTYSWHEHRLHAAAALGHAGPARRLAPWTIPLRVDGRAVTIAGELWYVPPPRGWLWLLPLAVALASAGAAVRTKRTGVARIAFPALAALAVVVARAGLQLYGRPAVSAPTYGFVAITAVLAALAVFGLLRARRELRILIAFVVGVAGLYQGAVLLPVLGHGLVLAAIPGNLERAAVSLALSAGAATCLLYLFVELRPRPSA